ncbi:TPA: hypothetical protein ACNIB0_001465 [Citrobacter koseri]
MGLEMIIGLAVAVLAAIAGAFGLGKSRGTTIAETKAEIQRTEERAAATEAIAERRVETTKEASNVQEAVKRMGDDDVDRELRDTWKRGS